MTKEIISILGSVFQLWNTKESRKYIDKYISLKQEYYEATNKPDDEIDDAVINNIANELKLLSIAISSEIGKQVGNENLQK